VKVHIKVPHWLGDVVKYHMERLRLLNLDGSPPGVAMGEVTRIWAETIAASGQWDEARDAWRLHEAFMTLARVRESWPAPRHLLEALPPCPEPPRLEPPAPSAEERARIRELLQRRRQRLVPS